MFGWVKRALGPSEPARRVYRYSEPCGCYRDREGYPHGDDGVTYVGHDELHTCSACGAYGLRYNGYGVWVPELSARSMTRSALARWAVFVDGVQLDVSVLQHAGRAGVTMKVDGKQVTLSEYAAVILPVEAVATSTGSASCDAAMRAEYEWRKQEMKSGSEGQSR